MSVGAYVRSKPGVTLQAAQADIDAIGAMVRSGLVSGQDRASRDNRLAVVWSSGDPEVAHRVCFMYTDNAKKQKWFDDVSTCGYNMFMTSAIKTRNLCFPVREAKNRFSELLRRAAQGEQITITLHGEPRAQLSRIQARPRPFQVDWKWLRNMKVSDVQVPAETLIRAERDGRD